MNASEQVSYIYTLPEGTALNSEQGRSVLAKAGDGVLPPELFHYTSEGKPVSGAHESAECRIASLPLIRIRSHRNRITVTALGHEKCALLDDYGIKIARLLKDRAGLFSKVERHTESVSLTLTETPMRYVMHQFVHRVKLRNRDKRLNLLPTEEQVRIIAERIERDFMRQADALMIDVPHLGSALLKGSIRIGAMKTTRVSDPGEKAGSYATLVPHVSFSMFAHLNGHWAAGALISRGHGRIWHDNTVAAGKGAGQ